MLPRVSLAGGGTRRIRAGAMLTGAIAGLALLGGGRAQADELPAADRQFVDATVMQAMQSGRLPGVSVKLTGPTGMRRTTYAPVESDVVSRPDAPPNVTVTRAPAMGPPVALFVIRPDSTYVEVTEAAASETLSCPRSSVSSIRICTPVARALTEPITLRSVTGTT